MKKANVLAMIILTAFCILIPSALFSQPIWGDDWLHTEGNRIYDSDGNEIWITGINWFGFDTGDNVFHGLWCRDLEDVLKLIAERGFNVLRIPLHGELVKNYIRNVRVTANFTVDHSSESPRNVYLEGKDSIGVLDHTVNFCESIGLKIIFDMHSIDPGNYQLNLWYDYNFSFQDFINAWRYLASRYYSHDAVIGFDLKNEPHGKLDEDLRQIAKWDSSSDPNNWKRAAETVANNVLSINSNLLIFIEGIEGYRDPGIPNIREKLGLSISYDTDLSAHTSWWGGNLMGVRYDPIYIQYPQQLVYSPHEYGPNVYIQPWFEKNFNRGDLEIVWRHYWFFIHENNLAPIHIGEWGGKIEGQENQDNLKWMTAFRDFIVEQRLNHTFWCLNQDSGDTGGLITGSDWKGFDYHKYDFIKPTLWQDADGNFVGLDHKVPLWPEGILIPDYYRNPGNLTPPPSYTPYPTGIYPNQTYPPYPTQPGYPTPTPTSPEYPTPSPTRPEYPGRGDVNGDGDIDIVDALIIASYYVQLPTPIFDPYAADVDNNGIIDIVDALLVAKIAVGLIKY